METCFNNGEYFQRYIVSATSPFIMHDCEGLATDAVSVIRHRSPALAAEFGRRGWSLPGSIDRVYHSGLAADRLGWRPCFGFEEVLAQMDRRSLEVLPAGSYVSRKSE